MTINPLTVSHISGEAIYASKHTTITQKINEIGALVNTHTDLYFYNDGLEWRPDIHSDSNNYLIAVTSWSGSSTNKIETANLNGKFLVSILIKEDRSGSTGELNKIELYAGPYTSSPIILKITETKGAFHYHDDTVNEVRYWIFNVGLYRLPDTTLLLRIYNSSATQTLDIAEIYFSGYA